MWPTANVKSTFCVTDKANRSAITSPTQNTYENTLISNYVITTEGSRFIRRVDFRRHFSRCGPPSSQMKTCYRWKHHSPNTLFPALLLLKRDFRFPHFLVRSSHFRRLGLEKGREWSKVEKHKASKTVSLRPHQRPQSTLAIHQQPLNIPPVIHFLSPQTMICQLLVAPFLPSPPPWWWTKPLKNHTIPAI